METHSSGPKPFCEIGRTHPIDRHRMNPLDGHPGVWTCPRHDLFARIEEPSVAVRVERGDPYEMHDGRAGVVVRAGDERGGGVLLYYRPDEA